MNMNMDSTNKCPLCDVSVDDTKSCVTLQKKGSDTINRISLQTGGPISVAPGQKVHVDCRREFTKPQNVLLPCDKGIRTRYNVSLDLQNTCIFCGNYAKIECRKRTADVYLVKTAAFQETIRQKCQERDDSWGKSVLSRVSCVPDLVAVGAVYHQKCSVNFRTLKMPPSSCHGIDEIPMKKTPGRPDQTDVNKSFKMVISYIEDNEDMVLTVNQLKKVMKESCGERAYTVKHMKRKLIEHYGSDISISSMEGIEDKVCLRKKMRNIVHEHFVKETGCGNGSKDLIKEAANIIKKDIHKITADKSYFPNANSISSTEKNIEYLPDSLKMFLSSLLPACDNVKISSIGQAIIQACRPKQVLPPLQIGLGVQLHHQFGSRYLIDLLFKMGFSASYTQVHKYEANAAATLNTTLPEFSPGKFLQFVADNVDHNTCTLDGFGTFHGMGIIACTTPGSDKKVAVPKNDIPLEEVVKLGKISIRHVISSESEDCRQIFQPLQLEILHEAQKQTTDGHFDLFAKVLWSLNRRRPNWSGFMQMYYNAGEENLETTGISFMPMINLTPSDATCINSTLHFVCQQSQKYGVTPVVTFDQPLFQKANDIISCCPSTDPLKKVVLRLGAFHTEMSFLGSIGHIMFGSGLKEVLGTVYAPNAVTHMLNGKAISRAIRGHYLADTALHYMIMSKTLGIIMPVYSDEKENISIGGNPEGTNVNEKLSVLYDRLRNEEIKKTDIVVDETIRVLAATFEDVKKELAQNRTASLWVQYMDMVSTLQSFIRAERIGDWNGHLVALRNMLPFFAASGHNLYLKSAYIYLQNMLQLEQKHPEVHRQFLNGKHVVRRSERHWAGLSTDLAIEQVLMRSLKSVGGVTRGRGMSETQMAVWLMSLPANAEISSAMQEFTGAVYTTSDQHKEVKPARISRDDKDTQTIVSFLQEHSPFDETDGTLRNIETGTSADDCVNVDQASSIGENIVRRMEGQYLHEYSFKRSQQVVTLGNKTSVKSTGEDIPIDPQLLFQRLTTIADRYYDDMSEVFRYELSSMPSSLFDSNGLLRLAQKAQLADAIWKIGDCSMNESDKTSEGNHYVIDGGSLIHRIPWQNNMTFKAIFELYLNYIENKYPVVTVVFDGYGDGPTIKDATHQRRCNGIVGNQVKFGPETPCKSKKEAFLSNKRNKQSFIDQLGMYLMAHGINVRYAQDDADSLIVDTAIELAQHSTTFVVGEDTDLLVLLCYHVQNTTRKVYLRSDIKPNKPMYKRVWDIQKTRTVLTPKVCLLLPFIHALTGCDTTSRIYGMGKSSALKALINNTSLQEIGEGFMGSDSVISVGELGEKAIMMLVDGSQHESLDALRYRKFTLKVSTGMACVQVHKLPPTSSAALHHSKRVFLQSQLWTGNTSLKAEDWGWELSGNRYTPVKSHLPPAPESLLNVIRCNCKSNCDNKRCTCRKHGLDCSLSCGSCRGVGCSNSPSLAELDVE